MKYLKWWVLLMSTVLIAHTTIAQNLYVQHDGATGRLHFYQNAECTDSLENKRISLKQGRRIIFTRVNANPFHLQYEVQLNNATIQIPGGDFSGTLFANPDDWKSGTQATQAAAATSTNEVEDVLGEVEADIDALSTNDDGSNKAGHRKAESTLNALRPIQNALKFSLEKLKSGAKALNQARELATSSNFPTEKALQEAIIGIVRCIDASLTSPTSAELLEFQQKHTENILKALETLSSEMESIQSALATLPESTQKGKLETHLEQALAEIETFKKDFEATDWAAIFGDLGVLLQQVQNVKFTYELASQRIDGDELELKVLISEKYWADGQPATRKMREIQETIPVYRGFKLTYSAGLGFGVYPGGLQKYGLLARGDTLANGDTVQTIVQTGKDAVRPMLINMLHAQWRQTEFFAHGPHLGIGLSLFETRKIEGLIGYSAILGKSQRLILNGGIAFGETEKLSAPYEALSRGQEFQPAMGIAGSATAVPVTSSISVGYYFGISYNITR